MHVNCTGNVTESCVTELQHQYYETVAHADTVTLIQVLQGLYGTNAIKCNYFTNKIKQQVQQGN